MQTAENTVTETPKLLKLNPRQHDNFWKKVNKDGPIPSHVPHLGKCWVWTANTRTRKGYGGFGVNGKMKMAHRVAWEISQSEIPNDMHVLHKCDNTKCVNPDHLFLGTNLQNVADRVSKGRSASGDRHYFHMHPEARQGERHGRALLTNSEVIEMRRLHSEGVRNAELCVRFRIKSCTVSNIVARRSWKHIK